MLWVENTSPSASSCTQKSELRPLWPSLNAPRYAHESGTWGKLWKRRIDNPSLFLCFGHKGSNPHHPWYSP